MIVSDSSPIIMLGKQGRLELLKKCFNTVLIPKSVYEEVTKKPQTPESISLEKAIREKWIHVENAAISKVLETKNIGQAEKEAISLAEERKAKALIDDEVAKKFASLLKVEAHGTLYAVYLSYLKGIISKEDAKNILKTMIKDGFYISTEVYARFLELVE